MIQMGHDGTGQSAIVTLSSNWGAPVYSVVLYLLLKRHSTQPPALEERSDTNEGHMLLYHYTSRVRSSILVDG
jgi:hypothetical protein